jgi:hypothetical protein
MAAGNGRERLGSAHDWTPDEVTSHGAGAERTRQLSDPDAYVMLGKLASAVARLEKTVQEMADEWRLDRKALRRERRRSAINAAAVIGVVQAVIEGLRQTGVLK